MPPQSEEMAKTTPRRKAYSYVRFSSSQQRKGDSLRRQLYLTAKYCERHKLQLDETLTDSGLSAYSGAHVREGKLAAFLHAIHSGKVEKGSILIVESLDRLSRQKVMTALQQLLGILSAGIEVYTLLDEQHYSQESVDEEPYKLMASIGVMARAHDESASKSTRLAELWDEKRKKIKSGISVRQVLPAWLRYDASNKVEAIEERVRVIKNIYQKTLDGWGKIRVCTWLDEQGIEPWGVGEKKSAGGWQPSYIVRLLSARTIIGEFQAHKMSNGRRSKRVPAGEPAIGYYPAIIDRQTFDAVQHLRRPDPRGRATTIKNLFTGLVFDGKSGAICHIEHHGRKGGKNNDRKSYLATARVLRAKHGTISWRYDWFEYSFLTYLGDLRLEKVLSPQTIEDDRRPELRVILAATEQRASNLKVQAERLVTALADGASTTIVERITALEAERQAELEKAKLDRQRLAAEETRLASIEQSVGDLRLALRERTTDVQARIKLRDEIRRVVEKIDLYLDGLSHPAARGAEDWPAFRITFRSGVRRTLWLTRPPPRTDKKPEIVCMAGDGYSPEEWDGVAAGAGAG